MLSFFLIVFFSLSFRKRDSDISALDAASWYVEVCLNLSGSRLGRLSSAGRAYGVWSVVCLLLDPLLGLSGPGLANLGRKISEVVGDGGFGCMAGDGVVVQGGCSMSITSGGVGVSASVSSSSVISSGIIRVFGVAGSSVDTGDLRLS